ncbi:MAG: DUF4268 domain-containing protein [Cyanobacteria bacterium J06621_3]
MTSQFQLGRLHKIKDLRTCWETENLDFTPWLAQDDNIQLLGDTIGLELEVEAQEKDVGLFRADILCKDTAKDEESESWVLIENQLERTDHIHLGQLLTYAAGLNAVTIIWIAARFTEEHRATLDWLNKITDKNFSFFGLEIELWRIGESKVAPKFNIISKPNGWVKTVAGAAKAIQDSGLTEIKKLQYEYWTAFSEYAQEHATRINPTKPLHQHWMNIAIGRSGFKLNAIASFKPEMVSDNPHEIRAEVCIGCKEAKAYFQMLEQCRGGIEAEFGDSLSWYNPSEANQCRIYARQSVDLHNRKEWSAQHQWLANKLDRLHKAFSERIKKLHLEDFEEYNETSGEAASMLAS